MGGTTATGQESGAAPAVEARVSEGIVGVIPTTGLPIPITRLKQRGRLPASYMALSGDFRPLSLSGDYDRFVKGPLQAVLDAPSSYELSLGAEIDCGRSWELPVLIVHWLAAREVSTPPFFWATGMVDADLSPLPGDYHIPTKIRVSRDLIADWRAEFGRVIAVLPPMDPAEAEEVIALFAAEGVAAHVINNFQDLEDLLNRELCLTDAAPAVSKSNATLAQTEKPTPRRGPLWLGAGTAAVLAGAFFYTGGDFGSALSTLTDSTGTELETHRTPLDPALSLFGLYAKDRSECISKTMSGAPLEPRAATQTVTGVSLKTGPGLCGLEFRNLGAATVEMTFGTDLVAHAIPGSQSAMTSIPLAPDQSWQVIFARTPEPMRSATQVTEGDATRQLQVVLE